MAFDECVAYPATYEYTKTIYGKNNKMGKKM